MAAENLTTPDLPCPVGTMPGTTVMTGPDRPLTPGEALEKLFLANADRGANAANDELVAALHHRARAIHALADMVTPDPSRPETTAQD